MIITRGDISIYGEFQTVEDIRLYLAELDRYGVPDDTRVEEGSALVSVVGIVQPTECGDHTTGQHIDAVVNLHACEDWADE